MARAGNNHRGGRPKGSKTKATLEKEAVLKEYRNGVLQKAGILLNSQFQNALGVAYMYRIEEHKNGVKEHVLIENPYEIKNVLDELKGYESGVIDEQFYYITVKAPDNKAIDSMLDRTFGKATTIIGGDAEKPVIVQFAESIARKNGINPSPRPNSN